MSINVLPREIFTLIAAGEVIDRPASIVKELVENSIDANASNITIETKCGGKQLIKIVDNGSGMTKDDLLKSILPHATSKIYTLEDLENILSLGFRGEALASIVAVAQVTITTRMQKDQVGNFIKCVNGEIVENGVVGCGLGTTIVVEGLFENVPARQKFLKRDALEQAYITSIVEKFILSNYNRSIKYIADDKEIFCSNSNGLLDSIYSVWHEDAKKMIHVNTERDDIKAYGYIGDVGLTKSNTSHQLLIVNGRIVEDVGISKVVYNCFGSFLMTRQYPVFVIFIEINPSEIDINIHPSKLEVKFVKKEKVNGLISSLCNKCIYKESSNIVSTNTDINASNDKNVSCNDNGDQTVSIKSLKLLMNSNAGNTLKESDVDVIGLINKSNTPNSSYINGVPINNALLSSDDGTLKTTLEQGELVDKDYYATVVGRIFDTYIVVQSREAIYIIDQHAAHEKLLYDKLCKHVDNNDIVTQSLLTPFVFSLSTIYAVKLADILQEFEKIGFEIRQLSQNEFGIMTVPILCIDMNYSNFVSEIVTIIDDKKIISSTFLLGDKLKQTACKSAIKAGTMLSESEINTLIKLIKESDMDLFCPHGRPVLVTMTKREIEKLFKRIV